MCGQLARSGCGGAEGSFCTQKIRISCGLYGTPLAQATSPGKSAQRARHLSSQAPGRAIRSKVKVGDGSSTD